MNIFAKKAICTWLSALTVLSSLPALTVSGSENKTDRFMLGDITQDGKITLKDSSFVQRACIELEKPSEQQLILGNVDAKEGLQLKDAYLIQHYVLGFDSDYPVNDRGLSIGDDIDFDAYNIDTDNSDIDTDSITDTDTSYSTDSATDTDTSASTDSETLEVTFECENTYPIIYHTRDFTDGKTDSDEPVFPRNGETGEIDNSGSGEVNFSLYNYGCMIVTEIEIEGDYDELITVDEDYFRYRITGIKSSLHVKAAGYYGGDIEDLRVTFECENTYPIIYHTREFTDGKTDSDEPVFPRNGETGEIDNTGSGEVNFSLYNYGCMIVTEIEIEGNYDALITVDEGNFRYRITGIKSNLHVKAAGYYGGVQEDSDTDEVEVLPLEDVQNYLNGDFERGNTFAENWVDLYDDTNDYIAYDLTAGINNSRCLRISSSYERYSSAVSYVYGLEPGQIYKVTVQTKAVNVDIGKTGSVNGVSIQIGYPYFGGYEVGKLDDGSPNYGRGYMIDCYDNWQGGTYDWKEMRAYFVADGRGYGDIMCVLHGSGTAYFDNMKIEKVNYRDEPVDKIFVETEHTGLTLFKEDIPGISETMVREWALDIDWCYNQYADLMGGTPFGGDKCYFRSTDEPMTQPYQALGCMNPVKWRRDYMAPQCKRFCNEGILSDTAYHELAHNFDTMVRGWAYHMEVSAEFKKMYVMKQREGKFFYQFGWGDFIQADLFDEYVKSVSGDCYEKSVAIRDGRYTLDAFNYITYRTTMAVGWDSLRTALWSYYDNFDANLYTTNVGKFDYLLMAMQQAYNKSHPDSNGGEIYDSFPAGEYDYIHPLIINTGGWAGFSHRFEEDIYRVQFFDPDDNRIWFEFVPRGNAANPKPVPDSEKYGKFTGWDCDISNITSDMTVYAQYENYKSCGKIDVTTGSDNIYQGEYAHFTLTDMTETGYDCNIICKKNGVIVYQSGYGSLGSEKFFLADDGVYTVYAEIKLADGTVTRSSPNTFTANKAVVIYYSGFSSPNIHYRVGSGAWTAVPGVKMTANSDFPGYTHKYVIPLTTSVASAEFCFNDGNGNWDNNGEKNYKTQNAGAFGVKGGVITQLQ